MMSKLCLLSLLLLFLPVQASYVPKPEPEELEQLFDIAELLNTPLDILLSENQVNLPDSISAAEPIQDKSNIYTANKLNLEIVQNTAQNSIVESSTHQADKLTLENIKQDNQAAFGEQEADEPSEVELEEITSLPVLAKFKTQSIVIVDEKLNEGGTCACGVTCSSRDKYNAHIKEKHAVSKDLYKCPNCGHQTEISCLKKHMRVHSGERPFSCSVCGIEAAQPNAIISHYKSKHSNEKDYTCPLCKRSFTFKTLLHDHYIKVHPTEPIPVEKRAYNKTNKRFTKTKPN